MIFRPSLRLNAKRYNINEYTIHWSSDHRRRHYRMMCRNEADEASAFIGRMWSSPKERQQNGEIEKWGGKEIVHDRSVYEAIIKLNDDLGLIIKKKNVCFAVREWTRTRYDSTKFMSFLLEFWRVCVCGCFLSAARKSKHLTNTVAMFQFLRC